MARGKRARRGEVASKAKQPAAQRVPSAVPDKYAGLSVYDSATRTVRRADGSVVPSVTVLPEALDERPRAFGDPNALYECEDADEVHLAALAKLANETVGSIQSKRRDWVEPPAHCASIVRPGRRRCWRCPRWEDVDRAKTPFD